MRPMAGAEIDLPPTEPPDDQDRQRVLDRLRSASPRLGLEEAERRMDAAINARTKADLALLLWDLPDAQAAAPAHIQPPKVGAWRSAAFRTHATAYGLVNGMLVGIWALTDSHDLFWPFFPIAGWGIGLGMNAVGARHAQRHKYEKEVRRLEKAARAELAPPSKKRAGTDPTLAAAPVRPSPTRVVVMFTDVVDSTRLTMVIGDEDWTRVRARYREMLHDCYRAYGGREVSSQGDGFLARFDRPANAVQCAVDFQSKLRSQRDQFGFAPAVRIGINSGDAIEERGDVLGTTVNLASRITSSAAPNEILVSEAVADQLDDRFELTDGGLREMKGLDRTAHVLSVTWQ